MQKIIDYILSKLNKNKILRIIMFFLLFFSKKYYFYEIKIILFSIMKHRATKKLLLKSVRIRYLFYLLVENFNKFYKKTFNLTIRSYTDTVLPSYYQRK
ncbi:hypothetical protein BNATCHR193 (nucleomorph) [Bigelowiella natans]|uniref:Uncharacterized protein n=1 Tax=Bigelowiella natans TaxID=227086 RepID=Q3LWJ3_BIGNA|nr:hypothetical protein BNATCHR193 [Bigelowiella natans]ABA27173.1 hypothetical protein [Bigelowiella natans]